MTSLDEAWRWYEAARRQATLTRRLAATHWDELPWDGRFGRDDSFRTLDPLAVVSDAEFVIDELADQVDVRPEAERLTHPTLRHAAAEAMKRIEDGSFFRVLEPFKSAGRTDLVEQVNQVRHYRNWVAHGRRGPRPASVTPADARDRLGEFLDLIRPPAPP